MKSKICLVTAAILLSGCSTVIKGTSETVSVNSLEKGTVISVDGSPRGLDTANVSLKKGKPHTLRAEKQGCGTVTTETTETFDPTSLLGIFIDLGIFTIPIDMMSGAAWKVEPTTYTLTPICAK
ncbi:MAG: hypothetical protein LW629_10155 [Burkholderiales bacterium]|jgi:uncharacterized protein YceK|nr:hypothetical protein [Burkholderiales bacterium]